MLERKGATFLPLLQDYQRSYLINSILEKGGQLKMLLATERR
jgi:hypothetical protein